jgi:hypothetical protein
LSVNERDRGEVGLRISREAPIMRNNYNQFWKLDVDERNLSLQMVASAVALAVRLVRARFARYCVRN